MKQKTVLYKSPLISALTNWRVLKKHCGTVHINVIYFPIGATARLGIAGASVLTTGAAVDDAVVDVDVTDVTPFVDVVDVVLVGGVEGTEVVVNVVFIGVTVVGITVDEGTDVDWVVVETAATNEASHEERGQGIWMKRVRSRSLRSEMRSVAHFLNWAMAQGMIRGSLKNSLSRSWETVMATFQFELGCQRRQLGLIHIQMPRC